jgi:methyl-accepting chemotaxis protein
MAMSLRSRIVLISSLAVTGVTAAGETIQRVVGEIERVSRIVAEIEVSMEEQSVGITQIDRSVAEMDRATQQNAALVEQSAAASAQLNDQAQHLAELGGGFKLTGNAA